MCGNHRRRWTETTNPVCPFLCVTSVGAPTCTDRCRLVLRIDGMITSTHTAVVMIHTGLCVVSAVSFCFAVLVRGTVRDTRAGCLCCFGPTTVQQNSCTSTTGVRFVFGTRTAYFEVRPDCHNRVVCCVLLLYTLLLSGSSFCVNVLYTEGTGFVCVTYSACISHHLLINLSVYF